jgi:hypothetical protein
MGRLLLSFLVYLLIHLAKFVQLIAKSANPRSLGIWTAAQRAAELRGRQLEKALDV